MNFSPVVDGKFLPRAPWLPDGPASSASVPMMIGTTKTETTALVGARDPSAFTLDDAGLRKRLIGWLPAGDIDRAIAGFRKASPSSSPSDLFFAITTTRRVRQQAWAQAERKAAQNAGSVWLYELDWETPVDGGKWKSPHSLDLAFVFDNVARSESMVGHGGDQRTLADQMSAAWLAFARTGDPNTRTAPHWAAFPRARARDHGVRHEIRGWRTIFAAMSGSCWRHCHCIGSPGDRAPPLSVRGRVPPCEPTLSGLSPALHRNPNPQPNHDRRFHVCSLGRSASCQPTWRSTSAQPIRSFTSKAAVSCSPSPASWRSLNRAARSMSSRSARKPS